MTMQIYAKSFDRPDETRPIGTKGRAEIIRLGNVTATRATFPPGWRWSVNVKPMAGTELCQCRHIGYVLSGRLKVRLSNGTERELAPGEVFDVPPGHDAWVVGDKPYIAVDLEMADKAA